MMAPIRIAVLDDYRGDAIEPFAALDPEQFEVTCFKDTLRPYNHALTSTAEQDRLVARLAPFDVISTMRERTPFPAALVARLPKLRLLLTTAKRNRGLDLDALRARGITVAGAVDRDSSTARDARDHGIAGGPDSTTQHFVALVLAAARGIAADDRAVKTGGWQSDEGSLPPVGLAGKVYATVGLGRLGAATARLLHVALGMRVIAWSPHLTQERADAAALAAGLLPGTFRAVSRETLFSSADVLAVHMVLAPETRGLVTAADLARMRPDAIFVNTSRGPVVDEAALLAALRAGHPRRAALDVYDVEPLPADSPWRTTAWGRDGRSQLTLTPHTGYGEAATMAAWYRVQAENLQRWVRGEPLVDVLA